MKPSTRYFCYPIAAFLLLGSNAAFAQNVTRNLNGQQGVTSASNLIDASSNSYSNNTTNSPNGCPNTTAFAYDSVNHVCTHNASGKTFRSWQTITMATIDPPGAPPQPTSCQWDVFLTNYYAGSQQTLIVPKTEVFVSTDYVSWTHIGTATAPVSNGSPVWIPDNIVATNPVTHIYVLIGRQNQTSGYYTLRWTDLTSSAYFGACGP